MSIIDNNIINNNNNNNNNNKSNQNNGLKINNFNLIKRYLILYNKLISEVLLDKERLLHKRQNKVNQLSNNLQQLKKVLRKED